MHDRLCRMTAIGLAGLIILSATAAPAQNAPTAAEVLRIKWVNPPPKTPTGVQHGTFDSACMKTPVGYNIYVPAAYETDQEARFPVVYFLHGSAGNESRSIRLATYLHAAIESGDVPPMMMVFANGGRGSGYIDSIDGTVRPETMITQELIPHIDGTYRTIDRREGRAVQGFSMGGGGSLRIAAKYPELFSSVVVYGAGGVREFETMPTVDDILNVKRAAEKLRTRKILMGEDLAHWRATGSWYLLEQNRERIAGRLPIRIVIGTDDYSLAGAKVARDRLEELKIAFEFELVQNVDHNIYKLYDHSGLKGLHFHAQHFAVASE
jgi:enterochelin esterase-like enzyme